MAEVFQAAKALLLQLAAANQDVRRPFFNIQFLINHRIISSLFEDNSTGAQGPAAAESALSDVQHDALIVVFINISYMDLFCNASCSRSTRINLSHE